MRRTRPDDQETTRVERENPPGPTCNVQPLPPEKIQKSEQTTGETADTC